MDSSFDMTLKCFRHLAWFLWDGKWLLNFSMVFTFCFSSTGKLLLSSFVILFYILLSSYNFCYLFVIGLCCFIVCSEVPFSKTLHYMQTSQLICFANQLTGLYILRIFTKRYLPIDYSFYSRFFRNLEKRSLM